MKEPSPLSSGIEESRTTLTPPMGPLGIKGGALASIGPKFGPREINLSPNRKKCSQMKTIINGGKAKNPEDKAKKMAGRSTKK